MHFVSKGLITKESGRAFTNLFDSRQRGDYAFEWCKSLTSVTVLNPTPVAIDQYVFSNRNNATLYVPMGSKSAYQAANYWKEFKAIIEIN